MRDLLRRLEEEAAALDWDETRRKVRSIFLQNGATSDFTDNVTSRKGKFDIFFVDPEGGFVTLINAGAYHGGGQEVRGRILVQPGMPADVDLGIEVNKINDHKKNMKSFRRLSKELAKWYEVSEQPRLLSILGDKKRR